MTKYHHSKHRNTSNRKPRGVKLARLTEKRRIRRTNQRHDARLRKELKSKSSATLVARSEELLTSLLEKYGSTTTRHDIAALLAADPTTRHNLQPSAIPSFQR
jgi:hypothetical protein